MVTTRAGTFSVAVHQPPAVLRGRLPLVLMLHGFPDLPEPSFAPLALRMALAGHCVAVPHMRGYESPTIQGHRTRTDYFMCDLGVDVLEIIAALRGRNFCHPDVGVVLVGHDWGSIAAQQAAAILFETHYERAANGETAPESEDAPLPKNILRGLVLIGVPPLQHFLAAAFRHYPRQVLLSWYMLFFQLPWVAELVVRTTGLIVWLWRRWSPDMDPAEATRRGEAVRAHLVANGRPTGAPRPPTALADLAAAASDGVAVVTSSSPASKSSHGSCVTAAIGYYRCLLNVFSAKGRYSHFVLMSEQLEYLAARTLPTLAMNGPSDGCIDPRVFAHCATKVRHLHGWGVKHACIDGTGHWPHLERPDAAADAILQFFADRRLDGPRPPPVQPKHNAAAASSPPSAAASRPTGRA